MHELGIVFSILDRLEDVAKENNLSHIRRVTLELGEVSTVIPEYVTPCFDWAVKKRPLFGDTSLEIETIHAVTVCNNCHKTYDTVPNGITCPFCGSRETELVTGNEINIKEIEAE